MRRQADRSVTATVASQHTEVSRFIIVSSTPSRRSDRIIVAPVYRFGARAGQPFAQNAPVHANPPARDRRCRDLPCVAPADAADLSRRVHLEYEEDVEKPLSWVEARLAPGSQAPDDFVLGAFDAHGQLAGSIGLNVEARRKQRHKGFVFGMYVAPEFAARGIGRASAFRLHRARARYPCLEQLNLTVTATNQRAVKLYETAGFSTFGVEPCAIKVGDAYFAKAHMVLRLRA
jgi:ribosomal protein S18 acetylase RimI-like enzyme